MPLTKDVSANIKELNKTHPNWPREQKLSVALNAARDAGAIIPRKPVRTTSKKKTRKRK